ncbi:TolB family protein [Paraburkholderia agricolaris]|uniref:TolB family protein n=1 Tax=Paraburkholderia agricolaris TaxID=2152888 RepID=UPI001290B200|nr:PD40 domain-containing protein [Paraburkholderia agricolaris]
MKRRDFLAAMGLSTLAACGGGVESSVNGADATNTSGGAAPGGNSNSGGNGTKTLPAVHYLTSDAGYTDYRPAISGDGNVVIFERTAVSGGTTQLFKLENLSTPTSPTLLLDASQPVPVSQTRPAWCWKTNEIAFNGAPTDTSRPTAWIARGDGSGARRIDGTDGFFYPQWDIDGKQLVSENSGPGAKPLPCNTCFDRTGVLQATNIDGTTATGALSLYGGMPTVGPNDLPQIAFAGQPIVEGWVSTNASNVAYNQDYNYIFLNSCQNGIYTSAPMEAGASVTRFDPAYQGRAPAWSPDGQSIVFESNRKGGYAIYLYSIPKATVTQITDPALGAQHAKFSPDGTRLVVTLLHPAGGPATRGIAWIDITTLL